MKQQHSLVRAVLAALVVSASSAALAQSDFKQLSGPPEEFGSLRAPNPAAATIESRSALVAVDLVPAGDGSWSWQTDLAVEASDLRLLVLAGGDASWQLELLAPGARAPVSAAALRSSLEESRYGLAGNDHAASVHSFSNLQRGQWRIGVRATKPSQKRGFLLIEGAGADRLYSAQTAYNQTVGQRLGFTARLGAVDAMGARNDRLAGRIETASLKISGPDGAVQRVAMFDDGRHGDGRAADGLWGSDFQASRAGTYSVQVQASGRSSDGVPFLRTAEHALPVVEASLALAADGAARATALDDRRLSIRLPVSERLSGGRNYRVLAELWAAGARSEVPVAWLGGLANSAGGSLEVGFDARWMARAGVQGPFELRNLRIEDADHFVTVAAASRLPLALEKLPAGATARAVEIDEQMLYGVRPRALATEGVGTRLLLVHGYCSGNVWGGVAGQFSNASVFQDLNQNRTHDQFAQRIKTFGATWNSFGIVAHSQGGAAALHLYTYYWSGLDNAVLTGGKRLIQSVGTPYQGTALAGNLAAIGQIFGAGCGTNTNLTYSGASSWLAGISSTRRAKVNYYTTSFTDRAWLPDWCHVATDLLLSDPDDGTTERAYGQLSGAVNQGHKTGWCHTSGMRDPAQVTDSSRNATMNANAAR